MFRKNLAFIIALLILLGTGTGASAFHRGGVASCDGCHSMHGTGIITSGPWLLKRTDPSSICLNCHSGVGSPNSPNVASPDGSARTPGGDFYWINKDFSWLDGNIPGERHGHNIVAMDYGYVEDVTNAVAPGGTYQSVNMGCNSCHDPHGVVRKTNTPTAESGSYGGSPPGGAIFGNYRLLGDAGYNGGNQASNYSFIYNAPIAAQNPASMFSESDTSHVDYGSGMSEWCANCHNDILTSEHQTGSGGFSHPVNEILSNEYIDRYNTYVRTGDLSGIRDTAYLQFVPFERGVTDASLLNPTSTMGPDTNSGIMCLSCHRAHASAFVYGGRWDLKAQTIADSHPRAGDIGVVGNDLTNAYYGRDILTEFGSGQKAFCDKCHDIPRNGFPAGW
jgi:predicted CXXCH cytochrome family protein